VRAELAKEEYATTWQEEEQGEPQGKRVARPQIIGLAKCGTLNARSSGGITQDQCTQGGGSKRDGSKRGGSEGRG
jgi:hypothetical protein